MIHPDTTMLLSSLNEKQKAAATAVDGIIRCIAGAGTGKTRVLTHRLAYLIKKIGVPPSQILSVTFTNKAAQVMKNRAKQLLSENISSKISTFHGFCHELLKEDILHINWPPNFLVMDREDQKTVIKEILNEKGIAGNTSIPDIIKRIGRLKHSEIDYYVNYLASPSVISDFIPDEQTNSELFFFNEYLKKQRKYFYLDFDDLILFTIFLLRSNDLIKKKWHQRISYIQVDEFQDVNKTQFQLLELLLGDNKNLFVVGDPDQAIYSFRGATPEIFLNLDKFAASIGADFFDFVLDENYRSTQRILNVSNKMITHNTRRVDKRLQSIKRGKAKPIFFHAPTNLKECEWISEQILELKKNSNFSDIAVLVRSNSTTRVIENSFMKNRVPYKIINGLNFFSRKEIKDCLAYLRLIERDDDFSFLRIINTPPRGIGEKRKNFLKNYASKHNLSIFRALEENLYSELFYPLEKKAGESLFSATGCYSPIAPSEFIKMIKSLRKKSLQVSASDVLSEVLLESGYGVWMMQSGDDGDKENILELQASVHELEKFFEEKVYLNEFLNHIAIYAEQQDENKKDYVKIMTIHAAKGLEFPFVFIPFLNEGILPSKKAITEDEIEEERRIAYVAMTRAEQQLFISNSGGSERDPILRPSRFLLNIGKELLKINGIIAADFWTDTTSTMSLANGICIKQGDKIACFWGIGEVIECWRDCFLIKLENGRMKKLNYYGEYDIIKKGVLLENPFFEHIKGE